MTNQVPKNIFQLSLILILLLLSNYSSYAQKSVKQKTTICPCSKEKALEKGKQIAK